MYETFYRLRTNPFQLSPDPAFLYSSKGHSRAMSYLVYGVDQGEGFIVITGEIGAGKTTVARALAKKLESREVLLAHVVSTRLEGDDIVRMVASAFGLPHHDSKAVLLKALENFLLASHRHGKRALLIVDEAQSLSLEAIEELRMLSNFQSDEKPLLQSFLLGQPEFRKTLQRPELEQLLQRVIAACHLGPLDAAETTAYVTHRLTTAGWLGDPALDESAFAAIHAHSGGIPRRINVLCNRLLLYGFMEEIHALTGDDVEAVFEDLQAEFAPISASFSRTEAPAVAADFLSIPPARVANDDSQSR
ncbi:MAG: XrtA/PEP-CTERM system-associated ATPase [Betaproteobacteria bacterium]